jgi:pilus assembly protein CpaE
MSIFRKTEQNDPESSKSGSQRNRNSRSTHNVATNPSPYSANSYPDSFGNGVLSIALISPEKNRRSAAVAALASSANSQISQLTDYPQGLDDVPKMLEQNYDVIIIDLDSDPEYALEIVESICANGAATVMVYSDNADPEMLVRCMRAGAREFLSFPLVPDVMAEALVRASARRPMVHQVKKSTGKLLAFMGAKGGAGATTLACNFAVSLAKESGQSTLLIDLDLPLGDAALNLGIAAEFSTIDALQAGARLDARFLSQLLVKHSSGLSVLAAPGRFLQYQADNEAINVLLEVARQEFENVVVDLGSKLDLMETAGYKEASTFYLVTQASIPELRNSNRLITQFFSGAIPKLEIVVNRFESRALGVSEEHIAKALTRPVQWKIPNDYASVRDMQIHATPLVLVDSAITRQIRQMVRSVTGQDLIQAKKKGFRLFG